MKRFLIIFILIGAILISLDYLYYYNGMLYLPVQDSGPGISSVREDRLYIDRGQGPQVFDIRGVNLGPGKPGQFVTNSDISEEEYLRWFSQIQDLGANVIRVYEVANPDFYRAFYKYNKDNPQPLYLLHGVWLDQYLSNATLTAFDEEFYLPFLEDCRDLVDIIHGRFKQSAGQSHFSRFYKYDISPWVYGYILGSEWESDLIVYTNDCMPQVPQWDGRYFRTEGAGNFEIFLASIADKVAGYEQEKYGTQRAISFTNDAFNCPLHFSVKNEYINKKYASIDLEHILPTDAFHGGFFASYHVYPYAPEYTLYEDGSSSQNSYLDFLTLLNQHHSMPVVISEFGVPSSRGMAAYEDNRAMGRDQGRLNETRQGEALVSMDRDIRASGSAGGIVSAWQDEWFKQIWNTIPTLNLESNAYWLDLQSAAPHYGLMSFDPGRDAPVCILDGNAGEWQPEDVILEKDGFVLSARYDLDGIYLLIEKSGLDLDTEPLYLPIDLTPRSGAPHCSSPELDMDRDADFIVFLSGKADSRVLVQERYDACHAVFGHMMKRNYNPYTEPPAADSSVFHTIELPLQEQEYLFLDPVNDTEIQLTYDQFDVTTINYFMLPKHYEAGKLFSGNGDPKSPEYDSLADFCEGPGLVELRLPWHLLNFADPTRMLIHDDYYTHFGVDYLAVREMYIGAGDGSRTISMAPFTLRPLGRKPQYHERLKQSYYILRDYWTALPR